MDEEAQKALLEKVSTLEKNFSGIVEELKTERKTKQEAQAELEALKLVKKAEGEKTAVTGEDVEAKIRAVLNENAKVKADSERVTAELKFKETHTEFSEANDPGGIKFATIKEKLNRLSDQGLATENDFIGLYDDAYLLVKKERNVDTQQYNPYASSSSNSGASPKQVDTSGLSAKEEKLMKMEGWDKEKFLKMKLKRPAFMDSLLEHVK